ncbi:unnamed protein product [Ilex paraguariensis]|uniref:Uncharacterized protein n=1 Tax=Ilex paraguariensis TaxID=185542 RepID=A0ABC8QXP7_9AQUA
MTKSICSQVICQKLKKTKEEKTLLKHKVNKRDNKVETVGSPHGKDDLDSVENDQIHQEKVTDEQKHDVRENNLWQEDNLLIDDAILDTSDGNINEGQPFETLLDVVVYESKQIHEEGVCDPKKTNEEYNQEIMKLAKENESLKINMKNMVINMNKERDTF